MGSLLESVLEAHGGRARWREVTGLTARLSLGGPFWAARGWPDAWTDQTVQVDARNESISFAPYPTSSGSVSYTATPSGHETIRLAGPAGVTEERPDPRPGFPPYTATVAWDAVQNAYFTSVATWNYLVAPFLFAFPGVVGRELPVWVEGDEEWRRLEVTFPAHLPNHNPTQVFYYDSEFRQRRMDYHPDVTDSPIAHYTHDPVRFDGFLFYVRRLVHPRLPDNTARTDISVITIDTTSVEVHRA